MFPCLLSGARLRNSQSEEMPRARQGRSVGGSIPSPLLHPSRTSLRMCPHPEAHQVLLSKGFKEVSLQAPISFLPSQCMGLAVQTSSHSTPSEAIRGPAHSRLISIKSAKGACYEYQKTLVSLRMSNGFRSSVPHLRTKTRFLLYHIHTSQLQSWGFPQPSSFSGSIIC